MQTARGLLSDTGPPKKVEEKKPPTFFSPRWFWSILVVMATMLTPTFWQKLKDPEIQGYWHASSYVTMAWLGGAQWTWGWLELNAPWLVKAISLLAAGLKAIATAVAAFIMAILNTCWPG